MQKPRHPPASEKCVVREQESGKAVQIAQEGREFLPAALEILDTPPNPIGRALALLMAAFLIIALAWSYFGEIDIVAVAQGKIVPLGGVKHIQSMVLGNVKTIHVKDGQYVDSGDLLIELDPTEGEVDIEQVIHDKMKVLIAVERLEQLIEFVKGGEFSASYVSGYSDNYPELVKMNRSRLESEIAEIQAMTASGHAEMDRNVSEQAAVKAEISKLTSMIPIVRDREQALKKLMQKGHTAKPVWQGAKTQLIEAEHNLLAAKHRLSESKNGLQVTKREMERVNAERKRQALTELLSAREELEKMDIQLKKANAKRRLFHLTSSTSGIVQQLSVNTIGGVVEPAKPLMAIVPDDADLEVKAMVLNKDIGFVEEGHNVEVKLEAFPFTKYGTIIGEVISISRDAIQDQNVGLVYETRIVILSNDMKVKGEPVKLTPGMTVSAEIKTGKRKVVDFLISPLLRYKDEAIRER